MSANLEALRTVTISAFSETGAWLFDDAAGEVLGAVRVADGGVFLIDDAGTPFRLETDANVGTAILRFTGCGVIDGDTGFILNLMGR